MGSRAKTSAAEILYSRRICVTTCSVAEGWSAKKKAGECACERTPTESRAAGNCQPVCYLFRFGPEQRLRYSRSEAYATSGLSYAQRHIRRSLVQPNTDSLQFAFQNLTMLLQPLLSRVQHNQNGVGRASDGNYLLSTSRAVRGSLNDCKANPIK